MTYHNEETCIPNLYCEKVLEAGPLSNQELLSMGYRFLRDNLWAKPVGYTLFVYDLNSLNIMNYFKNLKGESSISNLRKILSLNELKEFEHYCILHAAACGKYEFLSIEEFYENFQ